MLIDAGARRRRIEFNGGAVMNAVKALWNKAVLWAIAPALEERERRSQVQKSAIRAELNKHFDALNEARVLERQKNPPAWRLNLRDQDARYAARKATEASETSQSCPGQTPR